MVALNRLTTLQQVGPSRTCSVNSRRTAHPCTVSQPPVDHAGDYQLNCVNYGITEQKAWTESEGKAEVPPSRRGNFRNTVGGRPAGRLPDQRADVHLPPASNNMSEYCNHELDQRAHQNR